jgi:hypothetical protein
VAAESPGVAEGVSMSGVTHDTLAATVARYHQHEAIAARYRRLFGKTEAVQVCERKVHVPVKPWEDAFIMRLKQGGNDVSRDQRRARATWKHPTPGDCGQSILPAL